MKKLKEAGLFGSGLVPVSGSLAQRYNDCLAMLGVSPTSLLYFSIDAMGWSPEISEEKNENFYLNVGDANPNAIIISPEQKGKPVFMPSHSFDRDLMHAIFTAYNKQIRDITKDSAIVVHLDQHIDAFYSPFDLLKYKHISVSFSLLNDLTKHQKEQQQLVKKFNDGNNFIDREIHHQLLNSAKNYGDLRIRKLDFEPLSLNVSSFYTRAFGGVFLLRDFIKDVMVFEDIEMFKKAIKDTDHDVMLFHKDHDELVDLLKDHLIAEIDLKAAINDERYQRIKKNVFAGKLKTPEHGIDEILENQFLFKKYLNELDIDTRKEIMGVELYLDKLALSNQTKREDIVSNAYFKALHKPHSSLELEHQELIWKLLSKIAPLDILHLYWYDKAQFYKAYLKWNASHQDWAIKIINNAIKN
ncbi:hypothetical protein ULMS_10610 [Patiriisocius marinistellae]|uniref:Uncharacterized protein n=1 Tax=Patiriisocius marinistellae TaxID=2494560 RepID=A0A5J4FUP0_9FLAO|nr:DUF6638 family protein [Patiriisocius marinistellae]GEQ85553.1 hypothetical protein ULMS_10610 [Patiriisocius marinistellae]